MEFLEKLGYTKAKGEECKMLTDKITALLRNLLVTIKVS